VPEWAANLAWPMLLPYAIVVARGRRRRRRCGSGVVNAAVEEAVGISGFGIPNLTLAWLYSGCVGAYPELRIILSGSAVLGRSLGHDTSPKPENN
jgi:hypothetical protein